MALPPAFSPMIRGRDGELTALGELLGRVRSGSGAVLLIEGAAGMGKSRADRRGRPHGATRLRRCRCRGR